MNLKLSEVKFQKSKQAFTLIELSIVLVIIGLIIGGIFVGQDLIKVAENRAIMGQIQAYNSAVNSFRTKFTALPGDFTLASTYISASATAGDGNGLIATGTPGATPTVIMSEMAGFWNHLSLLSLIDGNYDGTYTAVTLGANFPSMKNNRGGILVYGDADYYNYYYLGLAKSASTTIATTSGFTPDSALIIDTKMDDGKPSSGVIYAMGGAVLGNTATPGATSTTTVGNAGCIFTVTGPPVVNTYNTASSSGFQCQLRVRMM